MPAGPFQEVSELLSDYHFLDEGFAIDFESIQVDTRRYVFSSLGIPAVPVGLVSAAGQQQTFYCLASSDAPTALQNGHSNLLRQQVVDPQAYAMLTSRIRTSLCITNSEPNSSVESYRVWIVLLQRYPGALSSAGLG